MSLSLLIDVQERPQAFRWKGPVSTDDLRSWLDAIDYPVPYDLIELWATLGGGDLFESEELFAPDGTEDDIREVTKYLVTAQGLRHGLIVFHRGTWVSAIDQSTGELVAMDDPAFEEVSRFRTLDEWYRQLLRAEFADRYGLEGDA
jgi:hypothetical protein